MQTLTSQGVAIRFVFALVLVLASYNPSGYSYVHWLAQEYSSPTPWMALAGIALIIGWVIYIRASLRSLGPTGLSLASILVGVILWALYDLGLISLEEPSAFIWLVQIFIATVLCLGMCWSHIRRRMSGQVDVDDV